MRCNDIFHVKVKLHQSKFKQLDFKLYSLLCKDSSYKRVQARLTFKAVSWGELVMLVLNVVRCNQHTACSSKTPPQLWRAPESSSVDQNSQKLALADLTLYQAKTLDSMTFKLGAIWSLHTGTIPEATTLATNTMVVYHELTMDTSHLGGCPHLWQSGTGICRVMNFKISGIQVLIPIFRLIKVLD